MNCEREMFRHSRLGIRGCQVSAFIEISKRQVHPVHRFLCSHIFLGLYANHKMPMDDRLFLSVTIFITSAGPAAEARLINQWECLVGGC